MKINMWVNLGFAIFLIVNATINYVTVFIGQEDDKTIIIKVSYRSLLHSIKL